MKKFLLSAAIAATLISSAAFAESAFDGIPSEVVQASELDSVSGKAAAKSNLMTQLQKQYWNLPSTTSPKPSSSYTNNYDYNNPSNTGQLKYGSVSKNCIRNCNYTQLVNGQTYNSKGIAVPSGALGGKVVSGKLLANGVVVPKSIQYW